MRDNSFFSEDAAVAADAMATTEFNIKKTPGAGIWLQFVITRNDDDADETLDISIHGKATATVAETDDQIGVIPQIVDAVCANGATIVREVLIQTEFAYINAYYDVGGTTPSYDIDMSIVSGPSTGQVG